MKLASVRPKRTLPPFRLRFGAGFVLLFALIYFFDTQGVTLALLPAVLVHELAHMGALTALGHPPAALHASLSGFAMDYSGELETGGKVIASLSGPLAGLAFAFVCARLGGRFESEYLLLTAGTGFVLNAFNLLPALPLDGGRALGAIAVHIFTGRTAARLMRFLGFSISLAMLGLGAFFFSRGLGAALIPAGAWILVLQKNEYL